ncbi:hypothetical protein DCAR_0623817 [Daucus carota subsp. sativus]|uniref:Uncharacterized protein n=1 Tax=Daucus carota subsp. sativus TaxID=79200 RepID=A0A164VFL5_DAUCS|nr:hypothetical protein DCAR_0623817 [Daucus carota subsp. sativus]
MASVKLAGLLLCLLLVFHASRDSSALVDLDKYASQESVAGHRHQDQDKDLEATKQEVMNLMYKDYDPPRAASSQKPHN